MSILPKIVALAGGAVSQQAATVSLPQILLYVLIGGTSETSSNHSAVQKSDFRILRTIGRGTYGKVYLVQHNTTEQIYAMKSVLKDLLVKTD